MLAQKFNLFSWTDPKPCPPVEDDRDGCLGSAIRVGAMLSVLLVVAVGAAARLING